jgi:hypothetical protein
MVLYHWLKRRRWEAEYEQGRLDGIRGALDEQREWLQQSFERLVEEHKRLQDWYANLPPEVRDQVPPPPGGKRQT